MIDFHQSSLLFFRIHCVAALLLIAAGLCGCSHRVIGFPPLHETWLANPSATGTAVRYQGWGICIDTYPLEGGITFGAIDKTYYFPGPESSRSSQDTIADMQAAASKSIEVHTLAPVSESTSVAAHQAHANASTPIGVRSSFAGVSLEGNPHRVGIALGFQRRSALVLDPDSDTLVIWRNAPAADITSSMPPVMSHRTQLHLLTFTKESHP